MIGFSIQAYFEERERKKREKKIKRIKHLANLYPDAYKKMFGSVSKIDNLTPSEIEEREKTSISTWQIRQRAAYAENHRKRRELTGKGTVGLQY